MLALRLLDDMEAEVEREGQKLVDAFARAIPRAVVAAATAAMADFRRTGRFKDRTGELRGSARVEWYSLHGDSAEASLLWPVAYASFVDQGTAPHLIRPKLDYGIQGPLLPGQGRRAKNDYGVGRGRFLRWYGPDGGAIFAREVHHPGTKPVEFVEDAKRVAVAVIERELEDATVELYQD